MNDKGQMRSVWPSCGPWVLCAGPGWPTHTGHQDNCSGQHQRCCTSTSSVPPGNNRGFAGMWLTIPFNARFKIKQRRKEQASRTWKLSLNSLIKLYLTWQTRVFQLSKLWFLEKNNTKFLLVKKSLPSVVFLTFSLARSRLNAPFVDTRREKQSSEVLTVLD